MSESAKRLPVVFIYLVLILGAVLVFWPVGNYGFVNYDDDLYVYDNPHVTGGLTWDGVASAFTTAPAGGNWLPLTWLSFMCDFQMFGSSPGWMHLVNLFFHLANTLLLFAVLRWMTGALWPSAFVAAAFALHPMHVESVAWITERKDVLSTFFLLLTLAAYVGYAKRPSILRYLMTLSLFVFGLMAKPMLVTLPLLLVLLDYWPLNRFDIQNRYRIVAEKIPFFVLAAASSAITLAAQRAGGSLANPDLLALQDRVANALLSYAKYVGKMLWPENLAVHYPLGIGTIESWQVVVCALLIVAISAAVIYFGRKHKYLVVGWSWFVVTLVPVIGLIQSGAQSMADRYTYIPYTGLFIMVAWGLPELLSRWPQRRYAFGISGVVALAALGICAHRQVSYWNSSIALFSRAIDATQGNYIARSNRASAYIDAGRWQDVIEDCKEALRSNPDYAQAHYNLGVAHCELGLWQEAVKDFSNSIRSRGGYAKSYYSLGNAYNALGRGQDAAKAYEQALRIKPDFAEAHSSLGLTLERQGRLAEAREHFAQAIQIRPNYAEAHFNYANALAEQGKCDEAIEHYRTVLRLRPDRADCMNNLAFVIAAYPQVRNRDTNEAIRLASRVCELSNYGDPSFLDTLAVAYASAGKFKEAVDTAGKALSLAEAARQPQLKAAIQHHLSFYTQGKPYVEPAPRPGPDTSKP